MLGIVIYFAVVIRSALDEHHPCECRCCVARVLPYSSEIICTGKETWKHRSRELPACGVGPPSERTPRVNADVCAVILHCSDIAA